MVYPCLCTPSWSVAFPQTNSVCCRESDDVVVHRVESIEEAPFLNRSVEAFFDECLEVRNVPWAVSRRTSLLFIWARQRHKHSASYRCGCKKQPSWLPL